MPRARLKGREELYIRPVARVTPAPGLQDPGYGLFGPLGEGGVGLAVVDGAVDV